MRVINLGQIQKEKNQNQTPNGIGKPNTKCNKTQNSQPKKKQFSFNFAQNDLSGFGRKGEKGRVMCTASSILQRRFVIVFCCCCCMYAGDSGGGGSRRRQSKQTQWQLLRCMICHLPTSNTDTHEDACARAMRPNDIYKQSNEICFYACLTMAGRRVV